MLCCLCSSGPDLLERCEEERRGVRQHDADAAVARHVLGAERGRLPGARRPHRHRQLQGLQEHPRRRAEVRRGTSLQVSTPSGSTSGSGVRGDEG